MSKPVPDMAEIDARILFEIAGTNRPAQLALEGPFRAAEDAFYLACVTYRHLSASWQVSLDPGQFLAFFEDLAQHRSGWGGEKRVATPDGEFSITCVYQGSFYHPEVWMYVRLATDSVDPYWTVELRLELSPDSLQELAARARSFCSRAEIKDSPPR